MRLLALVFPDLRVEDADASSWDSMLDALDDLSPRLEAVDIGVALVDIDGLGPMWGPERRIAARAVALVRGVQPLQVRCGIGDNRWLATLAARLARFERSEAPAALHILERDELADLALTLLPLDRAIAERCARFGLVRMSQLAMLPRAAVGAQFGAAGERLQALARGDDPRPLMPRRRPERLEAFTPFEVGLDGVGAAALVIRRQATDLCVELQNRHLAVGRAELTLRFETAPALGVTQLFPRPASDPDAIVRLLLSRMEAAVRARTSEEEPLIMSVGLSFDRLAHPTATQLPAFEPQVARWEELRVELERMRQRFGPGLLWRAELVRPAAALPERRARLVELDQ